MGGTLRSWHSPRASAWTRGRPEQELPSAVTPKDLYDNLTSRSEPTPSIWPCPASMSATIAMIQSDTTITGRTNHISRVKLARLTSRHTPKAAYLHHAPGSAIVPSNHESWPSTTGFLSCSTMFWIRQLRPVSPSMETRRSAPGSRLAPFTPSPGSAPSTLLRWRPMSSRGFTTCHIAARPGVKSPLRGVYKPVRTIKDTLLRW
ncbi:hypothetical protein LY78DRAFT_488021 [Colletotrichum sublineola]|nr:hypothetical protein LY78DRAFT_488021 [Colletotrichum sublineola]